MQLPLAVARATVRYVMRPVLSTRFSVQRQRKILDTLTKIGVTPEGTDVEARTLAGRPVERIVTPGADPHRTILFLHGGGYTVGSLATHRSMAAFLSAASGAVVYVLDYRLAPEHPYPAAVDDAVTAYEELLAGGIAPAHLAVAGDSAGGGLALALALRVRDGGGPLPAALGLISPWVDLTMANTHDDRRDPLLTTEWLARCVADYAAGDPGRPEISPLFADLSGLPPTFVHGASDEILVDDVERLVAELEKVGVAVTYRRLEGLWHDVHLNAGSVAEATAAVSEVGAHLRAALAD